MSINFDVVINTAEDSVDMKSGLDTLQGVSDATRYIAEAVLGERVPERQTHKAKVRTTLRQSFRGSYGQKFSVDIYDERFQKRLNRISKAVFAELVAYYLNDSVYKETMRLSDKAVAIIEQLGDLSDELVQQLRVSSLKNIHEVSTKFGHDVKIRYRKSREEQIVLAEFDDETASVLDAEKTDERIEFIARISRLNTNTGNGRLQIKGENETVAFGFVGEYKGIDALIKRRFSENLHYNNGRPAEQWHYLDIVASPLRRRDGKIIKYFIN